MTASSTDDPYSRRCAFCRAPPGEPCRTVPYDEHAEYGNGEIHATPHAARRSVEAPCAVPADAEVV